MLLRAAAVQLLRRAAAPQSLCGMSANQALETIPRADWVGAVQGYKHRLSNFQGAARASTWASLCKAFSQPAPTAAGPISASAAARGSATGWSAAAITTAATTTSCGRSAVGLRAACSAAAGAARQQSRGFARYLQFQPHRGAGRGWSGRSLEPNHVLYGLIGANVAGFLLWRTHPYQMHKHATVGIEGLRAGRIWTLLTANFSHRDFMHLAANMFTLYFFAGDVGRLFGGKRLLMLYLAGGVIGSLAHCGWYFYQACKTGEGRFGRARWFGFTPVAYGASAAVNAILVADILLFPTRTILLYGILPMPAALLGVLYILYDISGALDNNSKTAHAGHLGGAATGLAFFLLARRGVIRYSGY